jgi:hypothetical protein
MAMEEGGEGDESVRMMIVCRQAGGRLPRFLDESTGAPRTSVTLFLS